MELKRYIPKDDAEKTAISAERADLVQAIGAAQPGVERNNAIDLLDDFDEKYFDFEGEGTSWRGET